MKNNASFAFSIVLVIGDFLALLAAFIVAYILRVKLDPRPLIDQIPALTYIKAFIFVLPFWIVVHSFIGLYSQHVYTKRFSELGRLILGSFLGILVVLGYDFVTNDNLFPARLVPVYGLGIGFALLVAFRTFARFGRRLLFRYGIGISNLLVVGDTPASEQVANGVAQSEQTGQRVIGIVGRYTPRFAHFENFEEAIKKISVPIHSIVQTELYKDKDKNNEILGYAQTHHAAYRFVPGNSDLFVGNIAVDIFANLPVIAVHQTALTGWGRIAKRLFDIIISSVAIILFSPLMIFIALLQVTVGGGRPIFFRQVRITRFNDEFRVFKFRSHRNGLSGLTDKDAFKAIGKPELYDTYKANGYALDVDPRLTRLGRVLRKTSLDELPQLFNVLRGDISLVGPRPLIPEEINTYAKKHTILSVKSGLTGLAQISGRQNISFEERRKLDTYYVQNWSFWLDLIILIKTMRAVITGEGSK